MRSLFFRPYDPEPLPLPMLRDQHRAHLLQLTAALATLIHAPPAHADDWLAVWPACAIPDGSLPELVLLYPAADLPAVVHAGDPLILRLRTPAALTPPPGVQQEPVLAAYWVELSGAASPIGVAEDERHRHRLPVVSMRPDDANSLVYRMRLEIPAYLADGTYSLSVRTPFGVRRVERAVRVLRAGVRPRLRRLPAGAGLPPLAAATFPFDVWISDGGSTATADPRSGSIGDGAPTLQADGPALALRVGDALWVRSGCDDSQAFDREIEGVLASESRRRVRLETAAAALSPPPSAAEPAFALESRALSFDTRSSGEPAELSLLLPFGASVRASAGTLAFFPAREPSARTPAAKLARFRVPAGVAGRVSLGDTTHAAELALQPHRAHSGQPARVRVLGAESRARAAFAWGFAHSAYASPSFDTSFSGPLAQPLRAQVFRADGRGQVANGHVWVEPHRPPNCAVGQLGGRRGPQGREPRGALWLLPVVALGLRSAKNARRMTRPE